MEILHEFGFDIRLFVAQIVNFLVIAYIFKRFLYKPLLSTLKKRQELIEKGLTDADKASKALEKAEEEKDKILESTAKEAESILNEAKKQSEVVRETILNEAKEEVEKLTKQTIEQIAIERDNFAREARNTALEISRTILTDTMEKLFDKKEQEKLVKRGIEKIGKSE